MTLVTCVKKLTTNYGTAFYLWGMNIIRLAIELFVFYCLYKLVVDFIIPIYKTTSQMKGKMREMQEHMTREEKVAKGPVQQNTTAKPAKEDYIDYEEVK